MFNITTKSPMEPLLLLSVLTISTFWMLLKKQESNSTTRAALVPVRVVRENSSRAR
jgi:hypothetical protein